LFAGYYLSSGYEGTNATARMRFTQEDYTAILNIGTNERQITDNGRKTRIAIRVAANYQIPDDGITFYPLLRSPDGDRSFVSYSGSITKIPLDSNCYGGSLTVNADGTGTLVVDWKYVKLTSVDQLSSFNATYKSARFNTADQFYDGDMATVISSMALSTSYNARSENDVPRTYMGVSGFIVRSASTDSISTVNDLFAMFENAEFIYKLSAPVTYTLSVPQVLSLLGQNNVWTDTNGENTVTYIR
jgi:hypothetical protein